MRTTNKALAVVGASAIVLATLASSAHADGSNTPSDTAIVAVGSDTIQFLADQFQSDAVGTPSDFFSYDATPAGSITPKTGCASITRPNGSGAGISALAANAQPDGDTTDYCIDVARASRVPSPTDPTGLAFVPIAGDAVTISREATTNTPANLTIADLTAIYSCDDSSLGGSRLAADLLRHASDVPERN
jgi:ABC-type phosphate transport system substrate-binding protein